MEHHSNIVPWQLLCERTGAVLRVAPIDDAGELRVDAFERLLGTASDGDVVSRSSDPSRDADMSGNCLTQSAMARRVRIHAPAKGFGTQFSGHQPTPHVMREKRCVRKAGTKIELCRTRERG